MKNEAYYQAYLSHHHISRRGLLRHVFPATKSTIEKTQSRPPFSAREDLFSAVCNGCGECASACPNGLIQLKQQQATLEIDYAPCDLCGKCAEVCPTNALHLTPSRYITSSTIFLSLFNPTKSNLSRLPNRLPTTSNLQHFRD